MSRIIFLIAIFFVQSVSAQDISQGLFADSMPASGGTSQSTKWYKSTAFRIAAVPTVLIGYSLTIMDDHGLYSSQDAYDFVHKHYPDFHTKVDNYLPAFPAVMMYGLDLAGVESRNNWKDQTIILAMSHALNALLTESTKELSNVQRPDSSDNKSFPSGHTSVAFVMAEVLHQEFKEKSIWISVAGYSAATAVGVMRMLNNKHWLSDVVAGAGYGILSAKLTYFLYPKVQKKAKGL